MARGSRWEKSVQKEKEASKLKKEKEVKERMRVQKLQREAEELAAKRSMEKLLLEEKLEEERALEYALTNGITFFKQYTSFHIEDAEDDKIILPQSALELLNQQNALANGPLMFRINLSDSTAFTHCGVREFTADEGTVGLPLKVIESLHLSAQKPIEAVRVTIKYVRLPRVTYVKLQPKEHRFSNVGPIKAVLEENLRRHTTLTVDDEVTVWYRGKAHSMRVVDMQPERFGSLVDTDVEVDLEVSAEYDRHQQSEVAASAAAASSNKARKLNVTSPIEQDESAAAPPAAGFNTATATSTTAAVGIAAERATTTLPTEPSPGEPGVIACRVRLPSGKSCVRRFLVRDPMLWLLQFARAQPDVQALCADKGKGHGATVQLTVRQPTRVFAEESLAGGQSFEQLGVTAAQETFLLSVV